MYAKKLTYEDFNGDQQEETFYFNLTQTELTEMQLSTDGGYTAKLQRILNKKNSPELSQVYKDFILSAYGEKSDDGKSFVKIDKFGHRLADEFVNTAAYDALMSEFYTDVKAAQEFLIMILPKKVREAIAEAEKNGELPNANSAN